MKMVQRIMTINKNSEHKLDGIAVLKVFLAMFENLTGLIDHAIQPIVHLLVTEL